MNEYIIINKTAIQKRIEDLKESLAISESNQDKIRAGIERFEIKQLEWCLSQSTPLIPDIKDIQIWLSKQSYQKEYGEQEYMMYYDVDVPKIIQDYISNLKLDI